MPKKDPRVDAYIDRSAAFAKPILKGLRKAIHAGCPDVVETIKWSGPCFEHHGLLCMMAAFKQYCSLGFWKEKALLEQLPATGRATVEQLGRIPTLHDVPPRPRSGASFEERPR